MKCIGRTSQIILLFVVVLITGCGADGPAQFVDATNDMENWEVYFDKIPEDVAVSGAKEYGVDGTTLRIVALSCKTDIVVSWVGGQKTFEYDCPPNQIRRPKPVEDAVDTSEEDANGPPRATRATVEPPPNAIVPPDQVFNITLDQGVDAVIVNGLNAEGRGLRWKVVLPGLEHGMDIELDILWVNRDGTGGSQVVGPYFVRND